MTEELNSNITNTLIDRKYGFMITQFGEFYPGEPGVAFRCRDKHLEKVMAYYKELCELDLSPDHHIQLIDDTIAEIRTWQENNPELVRRPTSDGYKRRVENEV